MTFKNTYGKKDTIIFLCGKNVYFLIITVCMYCACTVHITVNIYEI